MNRIWRLPASEAVLLVRVRQVLAPEIADAALERLDAITFRAPAQRASSLAGALRV